MGEFNFFSFIHSFRFVLVIRVSHAFYNSSSNLNFAGARPHKLLASVLKNSHFSCLDFFSMRFIGSCCSFFSPLTFQSVSLTHFAQPSVFGLQSLARPTRRCMLVSWLIIFTRFAFSIYESFAASLLSPNISGSILCPFCNAFWMKLPLDSCSFALEIILTIFLRFYSYYFFRLEIALDTL